MKIGFVSAILPDLELEEVLAFANAEGFSCVELMAWPKGKGDRRYAGVTHVDVATLDEGPLAPDSAEAQVYVEHLEAVIRAAKLLGVDLVNTFVGRDWTKTVNAQWPRFLEFHKPKLPGLGEVDWGRFCSVLSDTGYEGPVCVEVEDRAYEGSLERRRQALRQSLGYLRNFA